MSEVTLTLDTTLPAAATFELSAGSFCAHPELLPLRCKLAALCGPPCRYGFLGLLLLLPVRCRLLVVFRPAVGCNLDGCAGLFAALLLLLLLRSKLVGLLRLDLGCIAVGLVACLRVLLLAR